MEKNIEKLEESNIVTQMPMPLKELTIQSIPKNNEDSTKKIDITQAVVSNPKMKCHVVKHNKKSKRRIVPYNHETRRQKKEKSYDPIPITYTEL